MKLHIGCGKKYIPGYSHIDVVEHEHVDFVCDTRRLDLIKSESVDEIYACHILEHVHRGDVSSVLKEWNRVLKENGVLRISVPNFEEIVNEYLKSKDLGMLLGLLYGGQNYEYNFHYIAFDFCSIKSELELAGFFGVEKYDWKSFLPPDYDDFSRAYIPHLDFDNGRLMSLNVVARKTRSGVC